MMNYPANTIQWHKASLVLHDAEEKAPHMLMLVTEVNGDMCTTRYLWELVGLKKKTKGIYENGMEYLHDPLQFGMALPPFEAWSYTRKFCETLSENFEMVRSWNRKYPVGTEVYLNFYDGLRTTITLSEAKLTYGGIDVEVKVQHGGFWSLRFVIPVERS